MLAVKCVNLSRLVGVLVWPGCSVIKWGRKWIWVKMRYPKKWESEKPALHFSSEPFATRSCRVENGLEHGKRSALQSSRKDVSNWFLTIALHPWCAGVNKADQSSTCSPFTVEKNAKMLRGSMSAIECFRGTAVSQFAAVLKRVSAGSGALTSTSSVVPLMMFAVEKLQFL